MGVTQSPLCFGERTLVVPSDVDQKNEMGTSVKGDEGLLHKREENRAKSRRLVKSGLGDHWMSGTQGMQERGSPTTPPLKGTWAGKQGQNEVEINSLVTKPLRGIKGNLPKDLSGSRKLTLGEKVHRS